MLRGGFDAESEQQSRFNSRRLRSVGTLHTQVRPHGKPSQRLGRTRSRSLATRRTHGHSGIPRNEEAVAKAKKAALSGEAIGSACAMWTVETEARTLETIPDRSDPSRSKTVSNFQLNKPGAQPPRDDFLPDSL